MTPIRRTTTAASVIVATTIVLTAIVWWAIAALDVRGPWFAFVVVWAPMTALGTISHVVPLRLPERFHRLREFEMAGAVYRRLGVPLVKRLLRRGPATWFNPNLRMPAVRDDASLERLDAAMRNAESSHAVLFVAALAVAVHAAIQGWWAAVVWTLAFDVAFNGYPVMLQRSNRARLASTRARLGAPSASTTATPASGDDRSQKVNWTLSPGTTFDDPVP